MTDRATTRLQVIERIGATRTAVPAALVDRLPPSDELAGEPAWHAFEHSIWKLGEDIRQLLQGHPGLRNDRELQDAILEIAVDRRAHRGRQPFVLLLGYKACARHAPRLVGELDDPCVDGHVISTLYRMKARGYSNAIRPFTTHPKTWIRHEAVRYVAWDAGA